MPKGTYIKLTKRKFTRRRARPKAKSVAKIAKQVVDKTLAKRVELKYMNTQEIRGQEPYYPTNVENKNFSCVGFSSNTNINTVGGSMQYPAGHDLTELRMTQPFHSGSSPSELRKYAIEGREVSPRVARTKFVITRDVSEMQAAITSRSGHTDNRLPPFEQVMPGRVALGCPVRCRMIQVVPIMASGTNKTPQPEEDLFLDTYGTAMGVDSGGIDNYDILTCPVNTRRYSVEKDTQFTINNPFNINWVPVHQGDPPGSNNDLLTAYQPQLANNSRYAQKTITCNYQLSARKNGKMFYDDPNTALNATSGHRRTYTFFHFVYVGGDEFTGTDYEIHAPKDLRIDTYSVSKFSDM